MDLPGPQHSYLRQFGPRGQILGPRALWPQILKLQFSHKTLQYGCLWTCLDPSIHIWDNLDPGAKFWVQGPFGPKLENCYFPTKPYNMGVYGLAWTSAFIFETIWTPGPNFGSKAPLAPNLKIAIFSQNLTIWVSIDLPGPQNSYLR